MQGNPAPIRGQLQSLRWLLAAIYLPTALILAWIGSLGEEWGAFLLRDTHSLGDLPFYAGLISNIGVVCWTIALAVCFFSGMLLRRLPAHEEAGAFLVSAGALTTLLMLDDFFLLHEDLFRYYLPVPELLIFGLYAVAAAAFLLRYRRIILASEYLLLLLALLLLVLSVAIDLLQFMLSPEQYSSVGGYVLEDGFKFAGILTWMVYFTRYGYRSVKQRL